MKIQFNPAAWGNVRDRFTVTAGNDPSAAQLAAVGLTVEQGQLYYNPADDKFRYYNGSAWADLTYTAGADIELQDNDILKIGTAGAELQVESDGTSAYVSTSADGKILVIGHDTTVNAFELDVHLRGSADTKYLNWDVSADKLYTNDVDINLIDDDRLELGTSPSVVFMPNGSDLYVGAAAHDNQIHIGIDADSKFTNRLDVVTYGTANTNFMNWDASANELIFDNADIRMGDNDKVILGDGGDITMESTGTNGFIHGLADGVVLNVGQDGTVSAYELDVKIFGSAATKYALFDASADTFNLNTGNFNIFLNSKTAPANKGAAGTEGDFYWVRTDADNGFLYICTATNEWQRVATASW